MNTTRETVEPAMRAAAEDVCGEYGEIVPADTRNLMGFYVSLRKLLTEVRSTLARFMPDSITDTISRGNSAASMTSASKISSNRPTSAS